MIKNGIYHDKSPTLTIDVNSAIFQAARYQNQFKIPTSVLEWKVPTGGVWFVIYDLMGQGFLPVKKVPKSGVPKGVFKLIEGDLITCKDNVYWLDPKYYVKTVYRSKQGGL
ncbi:MAG: hypothetical protein U9O94_02425 [Nanoarchaeota archaeon]|nr:hypothetical protein [Nanoarchaeota archaeon]